MLDYLNFLISLTCRLNKLQSSDEWSWHCIPRVRLVTSHHSYLHWLNAGARTAFTFTFTFTFTLPHCVLYCSWPAPDLSVWACDNHQSGKSARCATPVFSLERLVVLPSPSLSLVLGIPDFCLSLQDTLYMLSALELKSLWEKPPVIKNTCCHRSSLVVTFSTLLQCRCSLLFLALLTGYVSVCYPGMWVYA